jgi:transposase
VSVPAPSTCPHCHSAGLTPVAGSTEHIQEDIVIQPRTRVIRYRHGQAWCPRCHRPVVQAGAGELLHAPIGPVAKSVALYLRYPNLADSHQFEPRRTAKWLKIQRGGSKGLHYILCTDRPGGRAWGTIKRGAG